MVLYLPEKWPRQPEVMRPGNDWAAGFQWTRCSCIFCISGKDAPYPSLCACHENEECVCRCIYMCVEEAGAWCLPCMRSLLFPRHPSTRNRDNDKLETLELRNFTNNQLFKTVMTAFMRLCVHLWKITSVCACALLSMWVEDKNTKAAGQSDDQDSLYDCFHCIKIDDRGSMRSDYEKLCVCSWMSSCSTIWPKWLWLCHALWLWKYLILQILVSHQHTQKGCVTDTEKINR